MHEIKTAKRPALAVPRLTSTQPSVVIFQLDKHGAWRRGARQNDLRDFFITT